MASQSLSSLPEELPRPPHLLLTLHCKEQQVTQVRRTRRYKALRIYLPIDSEEGGYEVGIFSSENQAVVRTQGTSELEDQDVILEIERDHSGVTPSECMALF